MKRNGFKPGDYLVKCDRSGFTFYRSECRREWTGALVAKKFWQPKHPSLTPVTVKDEQAVEDPRPAKSSTFGSTTTSAAASMYDTTITLTSVTGISTQTSLGIELDNGQYQWTFATADPSGSDVTINEGLEDDVASGNTVYVSGSSDENFITLSRSEREALL